MEPLLQQMVQMQAVQGQQQEGRQRKQGRGLAQVRVQGPAERPVA